ncbi:MAG: WecB/TagA/CpsF family glycosyltransferase [Leptolyngbya sp. SIO4C1]|nr:WecB/TagA/CpsF family glycosyltransferase [Leptolyngbya sp. SIO4C1]
MDKVTLLDVEIDNCSKEELLCQLKQGVIFTPNVDHLMKLRRDPEFCEIYQKADFKVCDSKILMFAARFLGTPIKAKISGSDLFPWFCDHHRHNPAVRIFLLGGRSGIPERAQLNINRRIGRNIVVAAHSPSFGFERDPQECQAIIEMIRASSANVLVVGVGAPKQEKWIIQHRDQLPSINIFMAVGAALDFEAGCKPRAPQFVSELGLEWLYRLLSEPKRLWRRYLVDDLPFLGLVLQAKLKQLILPSKAALRKHTW